MAGTHFDACSDFSMPSFTIPNELGQMAKNAVSAQQRMRVYTGRTMSNDRRSWAVVVVVAGNEADARRQLNSQLAEAGRAPFRPTDVLEEVDVSRSGVEIWATEVKRGGA